MPFQISEAAEADLDRIVDIQFAAFGPEPLQRTLTPNGITTDDWNKARERHSKAIIEDPTVHFTKAIDMETNEIMGFSKWHIWEHERPESEWNRDEQREWGSDLLALCTDPKYQHRGAGTALVKWGCEKADEKGLPCYVEASMTGYPIYRSCGFEDLERLELDLGLYGGKGMDCHVCMIRPAKSGVRTV
ncbi:MAG: hypothetical protein M1834_009285 [Cirrosporium novae-zelandiae]|nr:MAG: hypothetical protein M1834_009285 [Cirrosporium novae-zelandiae]